MAKKTNDNNYFNLSAHNWNVSNVRVFDFGTYFTLNLDGLALYNLRVVPAGKKYPAFVAMPEELGRDNKYYKQYFIYLSEDDAAEIIEAVETEAKKAKRNK